MILILFDTSQKSINPHGKKKHVQAYSLSEIHLKL